MMFTLSSVLSFRVSSVLTEYGEIPLSTIKRSAVKILNVRYQFTNLAGHVSSPVYVKK